MKRIKVYSFPNGYQTQADQMFAWLLYASLKPSWGKTAAIEIFIPEDGITILTNLQQSNPARYGNVQDYAPKSRVTLEGPKSAIDKLVKGWKEQDPRLLAMLKECGIISLDISPYIR